MTKIYNRKVRKQTNCLVVSIPSKIKKLLELQEGDTMECYFNDNNEVVFRVKK